MGKRFVAGVDLWECTVCHRWNMHGKKCVCGRGLADELTGKSRPVVKEKKTEKKPPHRLRKPASEGTYIKSYMFKEKEDKQ